MRRSYCFALLALVGFAIPAAAQQPDGPESQIHVVGPGDTLWDLARRYLSNPYLWPEIFALNQGTIRDPNWIYPNERILIPGLATTVPVAPDAPVPEAAAPPVPTAQGRTVFFTEEVEQARAMGSAIRVIPRDEVPAIQSGAFYAAGMLVPDSVVAPVGHLEEIVSPTVLPRHAGPQIQPFDKVYMSVRGPVGVGSRVHLMRPGRMIPPHGRIYISTGTARVLSVEGSTATVEIDRMYDEVAPGDLVMAMPEFRARSNARPAPAGGLEGILLAFEEDQPLLAREDMAYINLGTSSGVVEGDEFLAYQPASIAAWGNRPAVDIARIQVVRAGLLTSAVRIVAMEQPAIAPGLPVRLVAKMP